MSSPVEQGIAASEERLRALVMATSDVIYSLSADWKVMQQLDGRGFLKDTNEPITNWQSRNVYPDDLEMVNATIEEAIKHKQMFQLEHRVWRADGTPGWTFSRAIPILNDAGEIVEWFGIASDITDRKKTEIAIKEIRDRSEQQRRVYETIASTIPDLMYVFDLDYRFTYANKALLNMWGKTWDAAIGKRLLDNGYEPWHAEMHEREIDLIKQTKQPVRGEVSFPHATLGNRVYDYILSPVLDENGEVEAIAGITRDVTERKSSEELIAKSAQALQSINQEMAVTNEQLSVTNEELSEAQSQLKGMLMELGKANVRLSESETDFRRMVEQAPVAILVFRGPELIVDIANKAILEILDKDSGIIGRPLLEAMPELKGEPAVELLFDIYNKGISSDGNEVPVRMQRDGKTETRYFNFSYRPLKDGEQIIGVMDVAVEVTNQVLARQAIEWGEEKLRLAIDSADLATWYMDAGTREFVPSTKFKQLFGYEPNENMPLSAVFELITDPFRESVKQSVENTLSIGAVYDVEYQIENIKDKRLRWVRAQGKLYKSDEDKAGNLFGVLADITEDKLQEQRKNDFLSIASHELKTPLTSLKSTLQVLDRMKKDFATPMQVKLLEQANRSVQKIGDLVDDLLYVNRLDIGPLALHKTTFNISSILHTCCSHVQMADKHQLIFEGDDRLTVNADENRIDQVVVNLVNNVLKYAPSSKQIFLIIEKIPGFAKISVKDSGPGISADKVPYLFNRYYRVETESKVYSGLGLGLYICAEIIKRHGGEIGVDTTPGVGSTFWFTLPLDEKS